MGAVYRAHDPQLQRDVAVKLISLAYAAGHGDPKEAAARFAREARVAARVQHPNVVAIYEDFWNCSAVSYVPQLFGVVKAVRELMD